MPLQSGRTLLITLILLISFPALADYGWMPKHKALFAKLGVEWMSTGSNYMSDGTTLDLTSNGETLTFAESRFYLEPEYGIAPDWAARMRLNIVSNDVVGDTSGNTYLDGGGLSDILLGLKYALKPSMVTELTVNIPTYSTTVSRLDKLIVGDGSLDVRLAMYFSGSSKPFFFTGGPALTLRSSSYSPKLGFAGAAGARFGPGYGMVTASFDLPLGNSLLFDTDDTYHNAAGTGSSYARLSGSPSLFTIGAKGGVRTVRNIFLELTLRKSVWGNRAPNFFQFGVNVLAPFEFAEPDRRKKIRQIPFESSQDNPPPPEE